MPFARHPLRVWIVIALSAAGLLSIGQGCPGIGGGPFLPPPVVQPTVDVELINATGEAVDPGLLIDGGLVPIDPPLAPGETVALNFDCFNGTTFQTDATLLTVVPIASDNVPFMEEGFEFLCGDVISFIFVDNGVDPFFTRVEVNGVFVQD